jgi:hypothetical protein
MRESLPADAVVQAEPARGIVVPQLIDRQMGVLDPDQPHVLVFRPRDVRRMYDAFHDVQRAYETADAARAWELLRRWGVTHVLAGRSERRRYGELSQFADGSFFEPLFQHQGSSVYRVTTRVAVATGR